MHCSHLHVSLSCNSASCLVLSNTSDRQVSFVTMCHNVSQCRPSVSIVWVLSCCHGWWPPSSCFVCCRCCCCCGAIDIMIDINPKDYRAWYGLGQAYEILEMHLYATYYYRRATALRYLSCVPLLRSVIPTVHPMWSMSVIRVHMWTNIACREKKRWHQREEKFLKDRLGIVNKCRRWFTMGVGN